MVLREVDDVAPTRKARLAMRPRAIVDVALLTALSAGILGHGAPTLELEDRLVAVLAVCVPRAVVHCYQHVAQLGRAVLEP